MINDGIFKIQDEDKNTKGAVSGSQNVSLPISACLLGSRRFPHPKRLPCPRAAGLQRPGARCELPPALPARPRRRPRPAAAGPSLPSRPEGRRQARSTPGVVVPGRAAAGRRPGGAAAEARDRAGRSGGTGTGTGGGSGTEGGRNGPRGTKRRQRLLRKPGCGGRFVFSVAGLVCVAAGRREGEGGCV